MATGLDLSLTSTGVALSAGPLSTLKYPCRGAERINRIKTTLAGYLAVSTVPVVIEGLFGHYPGNQAAALGRLHGVVEDLLFELGLPFVICEPKALKQYATGRGDADKAGMIAAASELAHVLDWPRPADHDQADAMWLRQLALDHEAGDCTLGAVDDTHIESRRALLARLFGTEERWPVLDPCKDMP